MKINLNCEVYFKLKEAEAEAKSTTKRYTHAEVMRGLREQIADGSRSGHLSSSMVSTSSILPFTSDSGM
jgi:hypothetical protein